jgi:hypothetical protein
MKISSSRCTTITNGKITSSIQRNKSFSKPISIIHLPTPPSLLPEMESTPKTQIIIRRNRYENEKFSYTCDLCACRCWSLRNMRRHIRLHADVRPYICNICQLKFKSYSNLMKHLKTSRHQEKKETNEKNWTIDTQALEEQSEFSK